MVLKARISELISLLFSWLPVSRKRYDELVLTERRLNRQKDNLLSEIDWVYKGAAKRMPCPKQFLVVPTARSVTIPIAENRRWGQLQIELQRIGGALALDPERLRDRADVDNFLQLYAADLANSACQMFHKLMKEQIPIWKQQLNESDQFRATSV